MYERSNVNKFQECHVNSVGKASQLQEVEALPVFINSRHMEVEILSAQRTGRLYPQKTFQGVISVRR